MRNFAKTMIPVACATLVAGCSATETKTTAEKPTKASAKAPAEPAKIGDSITLKANDAATRVEVRVVEVRRRGNVLGVELLLTNTGTATYDDSPSNGAKVISRGDREFDPSFVASGVCEIPGGVKISPGNRRRVCLPFEMAPSVKPKQFQFALDSGFGPQTGEWDLR